MNLVKKTLTACLMLAALPSTLFAAGEEPLEGVKDLFDKGGFVMVIIVALSVIGVALAFERFVNLRRSRLVPKNLKEAMKSAQESGSAHDLKSILSAQATPLARILHVGMVRSNAGITEMERSMEAQGELESAKLQRPIRPLGVIAQVEPLLGLLGTILGMITTFNLLHTTSAAERVSKLAPGIGQALYTTAAGLAIAIPFVLIHHHLQGRVMKAAEEWSVMGTDLVELLHNSTERNEPKPAGVPEAEANEKAAVA
ncbi:MAG: biopolymer transport protein ExbB [Planctomycetota bacterium]|jgi:biopolymer transport protein ExbB